MMVLIAFLMLRFLLIKHKIIDCSEADNGFWFNREMFVWYIVAVLFNRYAGFNLYGHEIVAVVIAYAMVKATDVAAKAIKNKALPIWLKVMAVLLIIGFVVGVIDVRLFALVFVVGSVLFEVIKNFKKGYKGE